MNLFEVLRTVWRARLAALGCAVLSAVVAILIAFHVSLSPVSLQPRSLQLGVGEVQVLVDSDNSTISNVRVSTNRLASLAGTYSEMMNSPQVIGAIARSLKVAPQNIGVEEQLTQQVQAAQAKPKEAQVGVEIEATRAHYFLLVRSDSGSQVIQIFTQAPNGHQARTMASAAVTGLRAYLAGASLQGHVAPRAQVVLRPLGKAVGRTIDRGASAEAAILIGVLTWIFALVAVITLQNQVRQVRRHERAPVLAEA